MIEQIQVTCIHTHAYTCTLTQGMRVVTHLKKVIRLLCTYDLDTIREILLLTLRTSPFQFNIAGWRTCTCLKPLNINFSNLKIVCMRIHAVAIIILKADIPLDMSRAEASICQCKLILLGRTVDPGLSHPSQTQSFVFVCPLYSQSTHL